MINFQQSSLTICGPMLSIFNNIINLKVSVLGNVQTIYKTRSNRYDNRKKLQ